MNDMENIKRKLLIKYPSFGPIIANTKIIENNNCLSNGIPTAATDGENIYYHKDILKQSEDKLLFYLCPLTEILLDTSGSISETLLKNFLRECKNILITSKVKAGCFDTKFYGFYPIRNLNDIDNMPFKGGGGTDFDVAVNAFSKRVENKIIFTDGCAPLPKKYLDAIWVVFGRDEFHPKGGKVIYINEEELKRLKLRR